MPWSMLSPTRYRTSKAALAAGRVLGKLRKYRGMITWRTGTPVYIPVRFG